MAVAGGPHLFRQHIQPSTNSPQGWRGLLQVRGCWRCAGELYAWRPLEGVARHCCRGSGWGVYSRARPGDEPEEGPLGSRAHSHQHLCRSSGAKPGASTSLLPVSSFVKIRAKSTPFWYWLDGSCPGMNGIPPSMHMMKPYPLVPRNVTMFGDRLFTFF